MTGNMIPERQNSREMMRLLRARSEIYRRAVIMQKAQLCCTVVVPVICAIVGLLAPATRPAVAALSLALVLLDIGLIDRSLKKGLKTAALVCEAFDCALLEMPWNRFATGKPVDPEVVANADRRWPKGEAKLENWYPVIVGKAPIHVARVVCQRTNLWYDAKLREDYGRYLFLGAFLIVAALAVAGLAVKLDFADFVATILAPATPIVGWAIREAFRQRDAAEAQRTTKSEADALWELIVLGDCPTDECTRRSREFQNSIFQRRVGNPLIFPMIYDRLRDDMEQDMNLAAEVLLRQIGVD